ncbi:unnamed protein product [Allacma fusca]|uniref:SEC14-like protein 2 n=1 Tax=Allacma fusca TaxID=39272 RepID=A0A8J2JTI7_9HEXA|nr:unnamed protein product [Allacma fusca]
MNPATEATPKEVAAIKKLRKRIQDILPAFQDDFYRHDMNLLRFLRARECNVKRAEEMMRKNHQHRLKYDCDNILKHKFPGEMEIDYPLIISGRDKAGYLVGVVKVGEWDVRSRMESGQRDLFLQLAMRHFESAANLCRHISTKDKYYFQMYGIVDCQGFQFRQVASKEVIDTALELVRIFEANCPEYIRAVVVINVPKIFEILWHVVKPLLTKRTLAKISFYGSNKDKYKTQFLEDIDADNLPSEYGGAITTCRGYRSVYDLDAFPHFKTYSEDEMIQEEIEAGQDFTVEVDAERGNQICWNFKTFDYDIGFSVNFQGNEGDESIVKNCRVDSHIHVQKGMITCEKQGHYILTFDNTFSKFNPKTLEYVVKILASDQELAITGNHCLK